MRTANRKPGKFSVLKPDPFITRGKLSKLEEELEKLKTIRPSAAAEVARLAELGDFSENVEYQMAKGRLRGINNAILKLENQIHEAIVIEDEKKDGVVRIGSEVEVVFDGKNRKYKILGSVETDPKNGVISYNSPIGAALLDRMSGEKFVIKLADREVVCKIISVI